MNKNSKNLIYALLALIAVAAGIYFYITLTHHTPIPSTSNQPADQTFITIPVAAQHAAGIQTTVLTALRQAAQINAYASVLDMQPLFDLTDKLATAHADLNSMQAQLAIARSQYQRAQTLYQQDSMVSLQTLENTHLAVQTSLAKTLAALQTYHTVNAILRQQYGVALATAADRPDTGILRQLREGHAVIVRISDAHITPTTVAVLDAPNEESLPAQYLSPAPADPLLQDTAAFYSVAQPLAQGLHLNARLTSTQTPVNGVAIPTSAVVWMGGQRWAYQRVAADRFVRRPLLSPVDLGNSLLVSSDWQAGMVVVSQGAQLLLSQEQQPQGVTTQCKDPPECDD